MYEMYIESLLKIHCWWNLWAADCIHFFDSVATKLYKSNNDIWSGYYIVKKNSNLLSRTIRNGRNANILAPSQLVNDRWDELSVRYPGRMWKWWRCLAILCSAYGCWHGTVSNLTTTQIHSPLCNASPPLLLTSVQWIPFFFLRRNCEDRIC